jgi:pyruvate dehydrogenase E2 component (dihydrolipoamide acetyltransferase)
MRHEIVMPRLSDAVEEGVLVTWLTEPGATVTEGDLIAEVQVEKVSSDVHAPATGRLDSLLVEPGAVVRQGATIAIMETGALADDVSRTPQVASVATPTEPPGSTVEREVVASPAARRLARELGVDLVSVAGSGPGGRIVETDVRAATPGAPVMGATRPTGPAVEPLSPMRRAIADRLRSGLASTAQLTITAEADLTELEASLLGWSADRGRRASYIEAIVRACALALREHPRVAARWSDGGLVLAERIDIGVAVALADGLIVPVIREADRKDLATLAHDIAQLAERAQQGTLAPADTEGACFSVTNLGRYRIDAFTPILNPPQTAILGVGRARPRAAVVDGAVMARTLVVLSLTFDHQLVDGVPAAAFLEAIVRRLEQPEDLLV